MGFRAYACGARVDEDKIQAHTLLLVTPSDTEGATYTVDVGFASWGPVWPMRLRPGETVKGPSTGEEHRLVHAPHPASAIDWSNTSSTGEGDDLLLWNQPWALECRQSADQPWKARLHFSTTELFLEDFPEMSLGVSLQRQSIFWPNVLVVRFYVEKEGEEELGRLILLRNVLKRKIGKVRGPDEEIVLEEFKTEQERVAALKKYFGIEITEAETRNIQGRMASLPLMV